MSFTHAMRAPGQTPEQGRQEFLKFVNERMNTASNLQFGTFLNPNGDSALFNNALEAFAELLHAVTDDLAPTHEGFQEWNYNAIDVAIHIKRESVTITPAQLDQAVRVSRSGFLTTFGPELYYQATGERAPQQVPTFPKKLCLLDRETGQCAQ